jgi:hypothetical protein
MISKAQKLISLLPALFLALFAFSTASANASVPASPGWSISSSAEPSTFSEGDNAKCAPEPLNESPECDGYEVTARNTGKLETSGAVTLQDEVPAGLAIREARLYTPEGAGKFESCSATGQSVSCTFTEPVPPDGTLKLVVFVDVESSAKPEVTNKAEVTGGRAARVSTERSNLVGGPDPSFGFSSFGFDALGANGALDTQAGDHPYELDVTIDPHTVERLGPTGKFEATGVQEPRDIIVDLPVGFVGSVNAAPQCTFSQLASKHEIEADGEELGGCPADTVVGRIKTEPSGLDRIDGPLYNMTPERGEPAEFAYVDTVNAPHVLYTRVVPTSKGYVLQTVSPLIPTISLRSIELQFFGVPAERDASGNQAIPFFTDPTNCEGERPAATIYMDSWENPAQLNSESMPVNLEEGTWVKAESKWPAVTGCNSLQFPAEVQAQPTSKESDKPTGLNFSIKLPQTETFGVPGTPTLKKISTLLPEGLTVNPAAGNGLQACSIAQIGWMGGSHLNFNENPPACPEASKIGSLELETPLLPAGTKVKGEMFLASQNANPFGSTLGAYVVVHDPVTGILIKIAGEFLPNANTGQMTAVFDENPNLPFSNLELHFFGGPRAELATPERCGTFTTDTELFPYSLEEKLVAAEQESPTLAFNDFFIDEACPGGFNPAFTAGSQNLQAGAFTPFVVSFERHDSDEELSDLSVTLPPGLLADVGSVPLCPEAQANAGTCPESSQVGTVQTGVGPGPDPLFVGGKAYLTGPYNDGPYGLSVVVPAVAGPYNFGTVVVRQSIRINPYTAQVTDVSDPFPKIIEGIPLRMRRVDVTLNREGFTFNPTNCSKLAFNGTILGSPLGAPTSLTQPYNIGYATQTGATSAFTTPFQVTNCQHLKFTPSFSASTAGKTSKADGASLDVKLSYPKLGQGAEANIKSVKVELPKALPSRLTTLQKACTAHTFEVNPAMCPKESVIGHAVVHTQVLNVPLEGPAYFVSHGGEAFPNLEIVLEGDGITVTLVGDTDIKNGITSSTFPSTPDVPFETFELLLPQGKFSALAANVNLCTQKLLMPTDFVAQNGAELDQETTIVPLGCKPSLYVTKKGHRGGSATLEVQVPGAGKLTASGKDLSRVSKTAGAAGTVTLKLRLSKAGEKLVRRNHAAGILAKVKLSFKPSHGTKLSTSVKVEV